jgi:hypothetical protein
LALAACGSSEPVGTGLDCFPQPAARWLAADQRPSEFEGRREASGPVTVYVDASGSMAGYLDGATEAARPLHDLIATIPGLFGAEASPVAYKAFGSRIRDVPAAERRRLLDRSFYSCQGNPAGCDNQDTRLDLVLQEIQAQQGGLAIVVTDMWFSDPGSTTTGLVPLAEPLEAILASGRSVGVYGVRAPFAGTIYDLPGRRTAPHRGERPMMILAIGDNQRVRRFAEQMARSPSAFLARGFQSGSIRQAIFTLDPSSGIERSAQPLRGGTDARVRQAQVLEAVEGVRVQQFRIDRSGAMREPEEPATLPSWQGPADEAFMPNAVWRGPLAGRVSVYERQGESCTPEDWPEPVRMEGGWSDVPGSGQKKYTLDPAAFVADFRRPGTYLVAAEVARTSLNEPNEATAWLREWSFGAHQGADAAVAGDPRFFRTLHLAEFARLLENSLADAAERNPGPITGFAFVVQVAS